MRKLVLVIASLLAASVCLAQGTQGTVEFTPTVGYWLGDTLTQGTVSQANFDITIDDAPAYGFRLAYRFTPSWAFEGTLMRERADLVTGRSQLFGNVNKLGTIDLTTGEVGFEGAFGHSRFVPFIAGGIGAMRLDPNRPDMSSDTRFVGNFGGGFKVFFTERVALRFDWRWHSVDVGNSHDHCDWWDECSGVHDWITFREASLGLTLVF